MIITILLLLLLIIIILMMMVLLTIFIFINDDDDYYYHYYQYCHYYHYYHCYYYYYHYYYYDLNTRPCCSRRGRWPPGGPGRGAPWRPRCSSRGPAIKLRINIEIKQLIYAIKLRMNIITCQNNLMQDKLVLPLSLHLYQAHSLRRAACTVRFARPARGRRAVGARGRVGETVSLSHR